MASEQFYSEIPTLAQFKQDHFDATVRGMKQELMRYLSRHISGYGQVVDSIGQLDIMVAQRSKESIAAFTRYLTEKGYNYKFDFQGTVLCIIHPNLDDMTGVDTTPDKKKKNKTKKRKSRV